MLDMQADTAEVGAEPSSVPVRSRGGNRKANARPELRPYSDVAQCPSCDLFFTSVKAFDLHLGGTPENRKCHSPEKMRALGMTENVNGVWMSGTSTGKGTGKKRKAGAA